MFEIIAARLIRRKLILCVCARIVVTISSKIGVFEIRDVECLRFQNAVLLLYSNRATDVVAVSCVKMFKGRSDNCIDHNLRRIKFSSSWYVSSFWNVNFKKRVLTIILYDLVNNGYNNSSKLLKSDYFLSSFLPNTQHLFLDSQVVEITSREFCPDTTTFFEIILFLLGNKMY